MSNHACERLACAGVAVAVCPKPSIPMCPWVHARATFAGFNAGHSLTSILHGASAASLTRVVVFDLNYHMYLFVLVALRIAIVACCLPILPVANCIVVFDPDLSHPACSVQQAVRVHMYRSPCSIVVSANRIRSDPIRSDPIRSQVHTALPKARAAALPHDDVPAHRVLPWRLPTERPCILLRRTQPR